MKQIYLAASWSRRNEARGYAEDLEQLNVCVKAQWLYEPAPPPGQEDHHAREMAYQDIRDIRDCDVFVRLADDLSSPTVPSHLATGARMFEQGLAYGLGKEIYVVGGKQMLFDNMPRVQHVKDTIELGRKLCPSLQ
jgi:nucleoside 2-deoxyribosyltransferase